jgi:division protein CdvB (Snf7/Vps24/ESCRT-III family)
MGQSASAINALNTSGAAAQAAGQVGSANAWMNAIPGLTSLPMQILQMKNLLNPSSLKSPSTPDFH